MWINNPEQDKLLNNIISSLILSKEKTSSEISEVSKSSIDSLPVNIEQIENEINDIFWKYKNWLKRVLRYFGEWVVVPSQIETFVKHIYLADFNIELNKDYELEWKVFQYKKNKNWSIIVEDENKISHEFKLYNQWEDSLLFIDYQNKTYREIPNIGNDLSHTISQEKHIKNWLDIDQKNWLITQKEKELIFMFNKIHDLSEYFCGWDIVTTQKTKAHNQKEDIIFKEKILPMFSQENREFIETISHNFESKDSLFKLYERIMYLTYDINKYLSNKEFTNITTEYHKMPFHFMAWLFILDLDWRLPNGNVIKWIQIPSLQQELIENQEKIENYLNNIETSIEEWTIKKDYKYISKKYWVQVSFEETKKTWQNFKTKFNLK